MGCIDCSFGYYIAKTKKMIKKKAHYLAETVDSEEMFPWSGSGSTERTYNRSQREFQEDFKINL